MKAFLTTATCMFLAATVSASAAPVRWQGEATITGISGTCPDYNPTGDFARVRFRPGIGGDNGPNTGLSFFGPRNATSYRLNNGLFTTTFKLVDTMYIGDGFGPIDTAVRVRFTKQVPAAITAATDFIDINGEIKGYDFMPNCTARFKMVLFKRVN